MADVAEPDEFPPTRLILVRHGRSVRSQPARLGDHHEHGLSDNGREEVQRLCARLERSGELAGVVAVLASGARCSIETALAISTLVGTADPTADCAFCEPHVGEGAGMDVDQWLVGPAQERLRHWSPYAPKSPGGESLRVAIERAARAFIETVLAHPGSTTVVVTHTIPLRASLWAFLGLPFHGLCSSPQFTHTGMTEWVADGWIPGTGQMRAHLVRHNDAAHLLAGF